MGEIVKMPQLGETVTEGTILRWLVAVGDEVKEDDPILEISTDKVDTEVPSPFSGKVTSLLVEEGETVEVGVGLMELGGDDSTKEEAAKVVEEAIEVELPKEDLTSNIESSKTDIVTKAPKDLTSLKKQLDGQIKPRANFEATNALRELTDIEDNRATFY